ncbi:molybdenum cofactor guanylyltransferase [Cognatilysobacter tabacisoli]|uniref:molybdenum cofactor guanylyltransferase n=1 Tax=Cognatilysobacter tabacisoli TaxID=2315424 RepID=UPI000E6B45A7|nr:NTP transferase domain-containing protein [Lysobacter tabacisoli]
MSAPGITVGILAGGRATRLGGADKAWLGRDAQPQVLRLARRFAAHPVLVSANRELPRHAAHGLTAVVDRIANAGPLAGVDALLAACASPWLLTVPVDVLRLPDDLLPRLRAGSGHGAFAIDADGPQPLCALWPVDPARAAVESAVHSGDRAVHAVQSRLGMVGVAWSDLLFGNLNTPADLAAAGIHLPPPD